MKRAVLGGIGGAIIVGIVLLWWIGRDTPEKALHDAVDRILAATSVGQLSLEVTWSDSTTRVTTGWSAAGRVDLKDLSRPKALGVVRAAQGAMGPTEQVADAILTDDRIALRPREVSPDLRTRYLEATGDVQGKRFATLLRDPFLDRTGHAGLIAHQTDAEIRKVLPSVSGVLSAVSWERVLGTNDVIVHVKTDAASLQPFMLALGTTWIGDSPTPEELTWIGRTAEDLAKGSFSITMNRRTRVPSRIEAEWPILGPNGTEIRRMRVFVRLSDLNAPVSISIPADAEEVTDDEGSATTGNASLPSSSLKTLPSSASFPGVDQTMGDGVTATGTFTTTTGQFIDESDTDLFHKYLEELRRSREGL
ncbi:MAG: hypothetical protein ABIK13_01855 [Patescibacteria group bacterium]